MAERQRIARERHDVVSDLLSVMVIQVGAGRRFFEQGDPERAEECAGLMDRVGREWPPRLEVFKLIARGMSNGEIAEHLVVGDTTVKAHVARILMKPGLRDRVQAVVFAYEHGTV